MTLFLLQSTNVVNTWSPQGELPLELALRARNSSIATTLVEHGADVNAKDSEGDVLIHRAIKKEYAFGALFLLKHNCDVSSTTRSENDTPLHLLAGANNIEDCELIAENLINTNVNVNCQNRQGHSALHIAIEADNRPIFDILLKQDYINVNQRTEDEHTPLYYALLKYEAGDDDSRDSYAARLLATGAHPNPVYSANNSSLLQVLILNGAENAALFLSTHMDNLDHVNNEGETALHLACSKGYHKLVASLLKHGANPNLLTNESRQPALHYAVKANSEQCINCIIEFNEQNENADDPDRMQPKIPCNFNIRDTNGDTPISLALNEGYNHLIPVLIKGKADVNVRNGKDFTLLHQAILKEDAKTAIFLLDQGIDINAKGVDMSAPDRLGNCALWAALDSDKEDIASILTLVEHRANVNARDAENKTPLHIAIENRQDDIISLLLSVPEIDLSLRDKSGLSPFATALTFKNNKAAEAILVKLPTAADQFDAKGQNFLHIAIKKGDTESALFLLTVQVDVNSRVQDAMLTPPLHLAAKHGDETLVRSLLLAGARLDDRDAQKRTALHVAAEAGNVPAVTALLENHADCDAVDVNQDNALHIAVREGSISVVRALLTQSTIDAEAVNLKGRNPLHELCKYGKENAAAICELFLECMPDYPINKLDVNIYLFTCL
ncbi:unnamed protein product [Acanthoscelides obtectus]|uniref:Uncharacterized protein n=1 Tax=Acanthoscelides obtectus TaxID=200917 RepID=A0A9P0M1T0_ACAOB|nr:unnamed protein product [Acanthoscelides obtectus]CAK1659743.1 Rabankyrin-5 [Acanthoscelides obtectus]